MFDTLLKTILAGLTLWNSKDKTKYLDQAMELKRDFYEEYNKGPGHRSNAVLDNIERELCILCESFAANVGTQNPGTIA